MKKFRVSLVPCAHVSRHHVAVITALSDLIHPGPSVNETFCSIMRELQDGSDIFLAFQQDSPDPVGFLIGSKKKKLLGVDKSFEQGSPYYVHWLVSKDTECAVQLLEEVLKKSGDLFCRSIFVLSLDSNSNSFLEKSGFSRQPDLSPRGDGGMVAEIFYRT